MFPFQRGVCLKNSRLKERTNRVVSHDLSPISTAVVTSSLSISPKHRVIPARIFAAVSFAFKDKSRDKGSVIIPRIPPDSPAPRFIFRDVIVPFALRLGKETPILLAYRDEIGTECAPHCIWIISEGNVALYFSKKEKKEAEGEKQNVRRRNNLSEIT